MSAAATTSELILPCKDCHQPVSDAQTIAYRLVAGILYGWCNECFNRHQRLLKQSSSPFESTEPSKIGNGPRI